MPVSVGIYIVDIAPTLGVPELAGGAIIIIRRKSVIIIGISFFHRFSLGKDSVVYSETEITTPKTPRNFSSESNYIKM